MSMTGRTAQVLATAWMAAALGGCGGVETTRPLTQKTADDLQEQLTGAWAADDGALWVRFTRQGVGRFASLKWDDKAETFEMIEGEFRAVEQGDVSYFSVRMRNDEGQWPETHGLVAGRVIESEHWLIWPASVDAFAKAVEGGEVSGKVSRGKYAVTVTLDGTPEQTLTFASDNGKGGLFQYRDPLVLRRLSAPEGKNRSAQTQPAER